MVIDINNELQNEHRGAEYYSEIPGTGTIMTSGVVAAAEEYGLRGIIAWIAIKAHTIEHSWMQVWKVEKVGEILSIECTIEVDGENKVILREEEARMDPQVPQAKIELWRIDDGHGGRVTILLPSEY